MDTRLRELWERRASECRLTPDQALRTLDEAEEFLHDRGMLTRTPDSALPSLHEAFHEGPYKPGAGGFAEWPRERWWWFSALARRPGVVAAKIHRGKSLLLAPELVALADPVCRSEIARMEDGSDPGWTLLLRHLADAGPSTSEDLRVELGLKPRELKAIRSPLERCGAIVLRDEGLLRWDQAVPEPSGRGGLEDLVVAGVRAAVLAPERELARWFSWVWLWDDGLVDRLVAEGRLERPEESWITAPASA